MRPIHHSAADAARRGSALVLGAVVTILVSMLVVSFLASALQREQWSDQQTLERHLENAADSAVSLAFHEVWGDFRTRYADRRRAHWDLKTYLTDAGFADQSAAAEPVMRDMLGTIDLPRDADGFAHISGIRVADLRMWREDGDVSVRLHVQATTVEEVTGEDRRSVERTVHRAFHLEGEGWDGLDYALLANNINCLMCHTHVDDAARVYNEDPSLYGTFERVKVGSLESLQLRESPHSSVAGTLYLAGLGLDEHGAPISNWQTHAIKSRAFDGHGTLVQDHFGDLSATDLTPADADDPKALANLYLQYASDPEQQVDGFLPDLFPSPFPDDGGYDEVRGGPVESAAGNRRVDPSEFDAVAEFATGSISGGSIGLAEPGDRIGSKRAYEDLAAGNRDRLERNAKGNVVMHGTIDDPIVLDGTVAIDGDVIISGYVVGEGSLQVSGNVFIPSDIRYADGTSAMGNRTFGEAADGRTNSFAIASGGNISVGDVFRPMWGNGAPVTGGPDSSFNFILDELANFNRMEWMKTQPTLPGAETQKKVGEREFQVKRWNWKKKTYTVTKPIYEVVKPKRIKVGTKVKTVPVYKWIGGYKVQTGTKKVTRPVYKWVGGSKKKVGEKKVTKTKWVKTGKPWYETRTEAIYEDYTPQHTNPLYAGADYVPRYYAFGDDDVVPIFNKDGHFDPNTQTWLSADRAGGWSDSKLTLADPTDGSDPILFPAGGPTAAISTLLATDGWLDDDVLHEVLRTSQSGRDGSTFEIDATLYSNNSVFGIMPGRKAPGVNGKLRVNGSIVAADIGLLAPRGVEINYDSRSRRRLDLTADTEVRVQRQFLVPARTLD